MEIPEPVTKYFAGSAEVEPEEMGSAAPKNRAAPRRTYAAKYLKLISLRAIFETIAVKDPPDARSSLKLRP
jgi:hypothetical protein